MSTTELPISGRSNNTVLHGKDVSWKLPEPGEYDELRLPASALHIHAGGNALLAKLLSELNGSLDFHETVIKNVPKRNSAFEGYLNLNSAVFNVRSYTGEKSVMHTPTYSPVRFRDKIDAFLDGAASIFTLGSEKPRRSSAEETAKRIAERRKNYRRYISGRES